MHDRRAAEERRERVRERMVAKLKISIEGRPKEIAALVLELQERHKTEVNSADISATIIQRLREKPDQVRQAFSL